MIAMKAWVSRLKISVFNFFRWKSLSVHRRSRRRACSFTWPSMMRISSLMSWKTTYGGTMWSSTRNSVWTSGGKERRNYSTGGWSSGSTRRPRLWWPWTILCMVCAVNSDLTVTISDGVWAVVWRPPSLPGWMSEVRSMTSPFHVPRSTPLWVASSRTKRTSSPLQSSLTLIPPRRTTTHHLKIDSFLETIVSGVCIVILVIVFLVFLCSFDTSLSLHSLNRWLLS